jgi:hypothetical protein
LHKKIGEEMIPYIIAFFVGILCGYMICTLVSGGETEGESYWRTQYFILKDKGVNNEDQN